MEVLVDLSVAASANPEILPFSYTGACSKGDLLCWYSGRCVLAENIRRYETKREE